MKMFVITVLVATAMFLFATKPIIRMWGGMKLWKILLFDLLVGLGVGYLFS